jgi:hypothetical protein
LRHVAYAHGGVYAYHDSLLPQLKIIQNQELFTGTLALKEYPAPLNIVPFFEQS